MGQNTSSLWKELFARSGTVREYAFDINGAWYGPDEDAEVSHSASNALYSDFGIGNATSAKLSLVLIADNVPKNSTIKRYVRLRNGQQASEWIPKGEFFTNLRSEEDGCWTIEAFDAMRKAGVPYLAEGDPGTWPRLMSVVVADIASRMGVLIDDRTVINPSYLLDYPNDMTMREILREVAAAHGGNWIINDVGALRLVPLLPSGTVYQVGLELVSQEDNGTYNPVSRVTLMVDEELYFTAGDDSGHEVIAQCKSATQAMVDAILNSIRGYQYVAYSAGSAGIDLAAELGDSVNAGGAEFIVAHVEDDGYGFPSVSAPGKAELDEEYPEDGPLSTELKRKVTLGQSYYGTKITRANGLEITKTDADGNEKSRVKLNSDVLAFYNDNGSEALYFDTAAGMYKFRGDVEITGGTMNINDNFVVDQLGNVVMNGSVKISGSLEMSGGAEFIKVRYSTNKSASIPNGWSETWSDSWSNTSTEVWAIYSYDGGANWTSPILAQGKTGSKGDPGTPGAPGSDANVPAWVQAYTQSAEYNTLVTNEWVVTMNLYGSQIFGGAYWDQHGLTRLVLNPNGTYMQNADLVLYSGQNTAFRIYDEITGTIQLSSYSNMFLKTGDWGTYAFGDWDFSNAAVTGLNVVFG